MKRAAEFVMDAMRDCLPDDVPLSFSLKSARWSGTGTRRRAVALVEMFDGLPASLEVWSWLSGDGCAHRWTEMPGGDATYEDGQWVRVSELEHASVSLPHPEEARLKSEGKTDG